MAEITIVGSGVIGMTTALCLVKAGHKITVITKERYGQTTSIAAAAVWGPFKAEPQEKVSRWSQRSLEVYKELAAIPQAGIVWHDVLYLDLPDTELPWWSTTVENFSCDEKLMDLQGGKRKAFRYSAPVIDTGLFLQYLEELLKSAGVQFINRELANIDEAFAISNVVVNCSGIGAIQLVNDHDLHPGRGQVVRIKRQLHHKTIVDVSQLPKLAYIVPRSHDTIIGGTYEEGNFDLEPCQKEINAIIERCQSIFPALACGPADILGNICGLRPVRSSVRVEQEKFGTKQLFHNYGHGGSGFTIAWGCAEEICALVSNQVNVVQQVKPIQSVL